MRRGFVALAYSGTVLGFTQIPQRGKRKVPSLSFPLCIRVNPQISVYRRELLLFLFSCLLTKALPGRPNQARACSAQPSKHLFASANYMSAIQIIRGTAPLPPDLEERFMRAYGREMTQEERRFFGLAPQGRAKQHPAEPKQDIPKAA